jgi:hypothetical protein
MCHSKSKYNLYKWTHSRTKRWNKWRFWVLTAASHCYRWCTALSWYGCNFFYFVAWWEFVTDKHLLRSEISLQSAHSCFIRTSFYGYTLLNASWTAWNDSDTTVRERKYVLLVNTPCLHLHNFCATGVSSGQATRMPLTRVSQKEYITRAGPISDFIFVP